MNRTSFPFNLTHAMGPSDASDAVNSGKHLSKRFRNSIRAALTRKGRNVLNLRFEAHVDASCKRETRGVKSVRGKTREGSMTFSRKVRLNGRPVQLANVF